MAMNLGITRRRALLLSLGALAGMGAATVAGGNKQFKAIDDPERDFAVVGATPLSDRAAAKGLIYGATSYKQALSLEPEFAARFAQECAMLVPEWDLKWKALRPTPDSFDFTIGDWLVKFARDRNKLVRGHTLVWHEDLPDWFKATVNSKNAREFLVKHIDTVVKHYAGQMHSWDVVNEAIRLEDRRSDGLRKEPWLELLGPDYIDIAFRAAAEADSKALLVYNDYGLDYDTPKDEAKRTAVLKLLERLKSNGTPIHALGIQAHLWGEETRFNPKKLRDFLSNVASMGLKILITEMDVADKELPLDITARDRRVAIAYEDYLSTVLKEPAVIAVLIR